MDLIYKQKLTIKEAAEEVGINYSTAKSIITLLRKTGRIDKLSKEELAARQKAAL
jgi:predicted transcriptional regulator